MKTVKYMKKHIKSGVWVDQNIQKTQHLYFIHEANWNNCKIGYTVNIKQRRQNLQTGNPNELIVTACVPVYDGKTSETVAHDFFEKSKIRGEWYNITPEQIIDFVNNHYRNHYCDMLDIKRDSSNCVTKVHD